MSKRVSRIVDLSGKRFGMLTAVDRFTTDKHYASYHCLCDCGNQVVRTHPALKQGSTFSCGCRKHIPSSSHFKRTHGATPRGEMTPEKRMYRIWSTMKQRTTNPKAHAFNRYGGIGIRMCASWESSFETFLADMGLPPTSQHTVDRVDACLGYSKENCQWATYTEQNRHRKQTLYATLNGETKPLSELAKTHGIPYKTAYMRLMRYQWTIERTLGIQQECHGLPLTSSTV